MNWSIRTIVLAALACLVSLPAAMAARPDSGYDPLELFAPLQLPQPASALRTGSGQPGAAYWQNRADYDLHATIDPVAHRLQGEETITYTNHSPDALHVLWLQLDQNIYRADSRAGMAMPRRRAGSTEGFEIASVE